MKKTTKALLMAACALALVLTTVMGTVAYLTSNDTVKNTFTVGKVKITLDETDVDEYGVAAEPATRSNDGNEYKLIPGHEYIKDPIVHFAPGSEKSYVFVEVQNGIEDYESETDGYVSIAQQIVNNEWTALGSNDGVYYKVVEANTTENNIDLKVFESFKIADDFALAEDVDVSTINVTINAYAIQYDGMDDPTTAWTTVSTAANK